MEMHEDDNQVNRAGNATEPGSVLIITSTINAQLLTVFCPYSQANDGRAQRNESSV